MISLKKYLDQETDKRFPLSLGAFRKTLKAIGVYGPQCCSTTGADLRVNMDGLAERLTEELTPPQIESAGEEAEKALQKWGGATTEYLKQKTNELKEMLLVMAHAAQAVGERDQQYSTRFNHLSRRLRNLANLEDLTQIRTSLMEAAVELKTSVEKMAKDGEESLSRMRAQLSSYQTRLDQAEWLASRDPLTGAYNRRGVEAMMEYRIARQQPFCAVMLDLQNFKAINDQYGHVAGDDLLKQFASELRSSARASDIVGRWGGDEFVLVLDSTLEEATAVVERSQHWFLGKYSLPQPGGDAAQISISAAIGVSEWKPGQSLQDVVREADAAMYRQKRQKRVGDLNPMGQVAKATAS